MRKTRNQARILIEILGSRHLRESVHLLRGGIDGVEYLAAVEGHLRECAEVETSDDAEVVGAAAESDP